MEVANASLYDGSTGLAEAVLMAQRISQKKQIPHCQDRSSRIPGRGRDLCEKSRYSHRADRLRTRWPHRHGDNSRKQSATDVAAVVVQSPNFFGTIEQTHDISELAHARGALSIVNVVEAMSWHSEAARSRSSEKRTADIVVGEGQSLGIVRALAGPHLGFMATRERYVRQMPGRLVGMGKEFRQAGFVLTLSTREQHIRREKATSNICYQSIALRADGHDLSGDCRSARSSRNLRAEHLEDGLRGRCGNRTQRTRHRVMFSSPVLMNSLWRCMAIPAVGFPLLAFLPELGKLDASLRHRNARREAIDAMVERSSRHDPATTRTRFASR